jgi:hypothetical protein
MIILRKSLPHGPSVCGIRAGAARLWHHVIVPMRPSSMDNKDTLSGAERYSRLIISERLFDSVVWISCSLYSLLLNLERDLK